MMVVYMHLESVTSIRKIMNKGKEGGIQQLLHKGFRVKKLRKKDIWKYTSAWGQEQNVEIIEPEKAP